MDLMAGFNWEDDLACRKYAAVLMCLYDGNMMEDGGFPFAIFDDRKLTGNVDTT